MTTNPSISDNQSFGTSTPRWRWASRGAMLFLGGVLILSGGLKALDLNLFVRQIQTYGLITHPQLTALAAWAITTLECLLGTALLLNHRPRPVLNLTLVLMALFTLLTLYAAIRGSVEDCGCFGALVKRTPMQAAVEDGVLLFLCVVARRGLREDVNRAVWPRALFVGAMALLGAGLPFYSGVPSALLAESPSETGGLWADLQVAGVADLDLTKDTHIVVLMSAGCQHCQEAVPEVAMLMDELQSQPVSIVGLGQDSAEDLQDFIDEWAPPYAIGRIDSGSFWGLLEDAELPRMLLVKGGRTVKVWDGAVPDAEEVIQLIGQ